MDLQRQHYVLKSTILSSPTFQLNSYCDGQVNEGW